MDRRVFIPRSSSDASPAKDDGTDLELEDAAREEIRKLLQCQDVDSASSILRIELLEFMEVSDESLQVPDLTMSEDNRSDISSSSSVRFLVATSVTEVPAGWKHALTMMSTPKRKTKSSPLYMINPLSTTITPDDLSADISSVRSTSHSSLPNASTPSVSHVNAPSARYPLKAIPSLCIDAIRPSDEECSKVKLFRQIGGEAKAALYPFTETSDGKKKAILTLMTPVTKKSASKVSEAEASKLSPTSKTKHVNEKKESTDGVVQSTSSIVTADAADMPVFPKQPERQISADLSSTSKAASASMTKNLEQNISYTAAVKKNLVAKTSSTPSIKLPPKPIQQTISAAAEGFTSKPVILRIANIPWNLTVDGLVAWLGKGTENQLLPLNVQIVSVHILCDRIKGRSRVPAFVELNNARIAHSIIVSKSMTELQGRSIKISIGTKKELLALLFPTWAANAPDFTMNDKTVILSDTELTGLRRLCSLQAPFLKGTPERPFMNILSIASKYPWRNTDSLTSQGDEQSKALQLIRDGHKLLNQYGKRLPNYTKIKSLFVTFLTAHGGTSGSLRAIPVDESVCSSRNSSAKSSPPTRPRGSIARTVVFEAAERPADDGVAAVDASTIQPVLDSQPVIEASKNFAHTNPTPDAVAEMNAVLSRLLLACQTGTSLAVPLTQSNVGERDPVHTSTPKPIQSGAGQAENKIEKQMHHEMTRKTLSSLVSQPSMESVPLPTVAEISSDNAVPMITPPKNVAASVRAIQKENAAWDRLTARNRDGIANSQRVFVPSKSSVTGPCVAQHREAGSASSHSKILPPSNRYVPVRKTGRLLVKETSEQSVVSMASSSPLVMEKAHKSESLFTPFTSPSIYKKLGSSKSVSRHPSIAESSTKTSISRHPSIAESASTFTTASAECAKSFLPYPPGFVPAHLVNLQAKQQDTVGGNVLPTFTASQYASNAHTTDNPTCVDADGKVDLNRLADSLGIQKQAMMRLFSALGSMA